MNMYHKPSRALASDYSDDVDPPIPVDVDPPKRG